jgi:uncharacterized protein YqeY
MRTVTATADDTGPELVTRLRADLTAALGSGDRVAVAALRSALAAIGNAEAVDLTTDAGPAASPPAASEHFAGARAGPGASEVTRKRLTVADVTRIVADEIAERQSAAAEYDRLDPSSCRAE